MVPDAVKVSWTQAVQGYAALSVEQQRAATAQNAMGGLYRVEAWTDRGAGWVPWASLDLAYRTLRDDAQAGASYAGVRSDGGPTSILEGAANAAWKIDVAAFGEPASDKLGATVAAASERVAAVADFATSPLGLAFLATCAVLLVVVAVRR